MQDDDLELIDLIKAYYHDPDDVQLHFSLARRVDAGKNWNPAPMQFIRRAIELAPGYGKAHMFAAVFAPREVDMELHAYLGQHLLPSNSFAISHYLDYIIQRNKFPEDTYLIEKAVMLDPENIAPYWQGILLFRRVERYREALELAKQLKEILTPPVSARTLYCLNSNPNRAVRAKFSSDSCVEEVEELIDELIQKMRVGRR
jgi:tetratricopeptide (TPR) repeat protein